MRAIIQRVSEASVTVGAETVGAIGTGLLVYAGVAQGDGLEDVSYLSRKIRYARVFRDDAGKMNLDVAQAGGAVLVVSNFTLMADMHQGRRPAFTRAAEPERAEDLYLRLCEALREQGLRVETGCFGEMMSVVAANDGPINMLLDSRRLF